MIVFFFFSSRRRHTRLQGDWSSDVCSSDLFRDIKTVLETGQTFESSRKPGQMLTPDEMMEEERAEGMPEALIRQEYLCDWAAANVGSVFGDLLPEPAEFE